MRSCGRAPLPYLHGLSSGDFAAALGRFLELSAGLPVVLRDLQTARGCCFQRDFPMSATPAGHYAAYLTNIDGFEADRAALPGPGIRCCSSPPHGADASWIPWSREWVIQDERTDDSP